MERGTALWIAALLACTVHLTASLDKSFALERPVHASVVVLLVCGTALLLSERIRPLRAKSQHQEQQYAPIPLSDLGDTHGSRPVSPASVDASAPEYRPKIGLKLQCLIVVFLLSARVEILRQVVASVECSTSTTETVVPIFVALADWWFIQRHRRKPRDQEDDMNSTVYSDMFSGIAGSHWRPIVAVVLLSWSSTAAIARAMPARSTYICSQVSRESSMIPRLQVAGVVLDGLLSVLVFPLLDSIPRKPSNISNKGIPYLGLSCLNNCRALKCSSGRECTATKVETTPGQCPNPYGLLPQPPQADYDTEFDHVADCVLLQLSAALWIVIGAGLYHQGSAHTRSLISPTPMHFTPSVIKLALTVSLTLACALHVARKIGMLNTSVLVLFTSAYTSLFVCTWNHSHPFPPLPGGLVLSLTGMTLGLIFYSFPESSADEVHRASTKPKPLSRYWGFYPILGVLYFFQVMLAFNGDDEVRYHPIDMLMYNAKERHDDWLKWASSSDSVQSAAANYTARYKRHPPPHFDEWYSYAVSHSSIIIDDYDAVYDDLLPYWSLSPAEIRARTWEAIADPSKGVGGIFIRDGKAQIAPNVPRNQRMMLDGIVQMIDKFGKWLPDMDLAFNLNNECRVSVPYEEMETAKADAETSFGNEKKSSELVNDFTADRASGWQQLPESPHSSEHFVTLSSRSTWDEFGSISCPPGSPARTQRMWNHRNYCASCALPHSLGAFFANWTLASDICYQPDLADLHGFYTSPNMFMGTHRLMPIFSQSKAPGFKDILYPSAWNYMNRVAYAPTDEHPDPPFDDKQNTLFWRGATSEGFATADSTAWHGMTRQRLVHTLNLTSSPQVLPLKHPIASYRRKLRYVPLTPSQLHSSISTDISFASIARCAEPSCAHQRAHFGVPPGEARTAFQAHWQHRHLVDADGAGFSGRFLAFLHSRSLPFKVAPLFREWWHGRVTPWLHFVPLDPRLQGLWATAAFFQGFKGEVGGREVEMAPKEKAGARIAEEGRGWAGRVLRGVDMEVYFFRLLLEWGRVTDDGREGIGFVAGGEGGGGE